MAFDQPESRPAVAKARYPWRLSGQQQQDTPAAVQSSERAAASARTAASQPAGTQQAAGGLAVYTPPGTQGGYDAYAPPAGGDTQFAGGSPGDWRNVGQTPPAAGSPPIPSMQPPPGARQNDLSGQVPANQVYAQAFNQASEQVGSPNRATSYTMPGTRTSRSLNPATGQYSEPQTQQSFDGNMAYNAIDNRPGPIQARATGIDGSAMPWQDALSQREAFTGGLVERLGQYQSGAQTGRPEINPGQILNQANERLADGSFSNPFRNPVAPALSQRAPQSPQAAGSFSQKFTYGDSTFQGYGAGQNPDVQRAMGNASPYMQGIFQNPFGDSPQANNPMPSFDQQFYDPSAPRNYDMRTPARSVVAPAPSRPGSAKPIPPQSQGTPYQQPAARGASRPPAARGASRTPWR